MGKPIIGHVIEKAIESKIFSKVNVSTDSTEVSDVSKRFWRGSSLCQA